MSKMEAYRLPRLVFHTDYPTRPLEKRVGDHRWGWEEGYGLLFLGGLSIYQRAAEER